MMSLSVINSARERFLTSQAEARERDERILAALEQRKLAQERPNERLIIKANSESEAHAFTMARGLTPGRIARVSEGIAQFAVDVHCTDVTVLQHWFNDVHMVGEALTNYADGTLLLFNALHRSHSNGYAADSAADLGLAM